MRDWDFMMNKWIDEWMELQAEWVNTWVCGSAKYGPNKWTDEGTTGCTSELVTEHNYRVIRWRAEWGELHTVWTSEHMSEQQGYQMNRWACEYGTAGLQSERRGGHVLCLIVKYLPRGAAGFCVYTPPRLQSFNEIRVSHSFVSHET
jgi:hypothetical protein